MNDTSDGIFVKSMFLFSASPVVFSIPITQSSRPCPAPAQPASTMLRSLVLFAVGAVASVTHLPVVEPRAAAEIENRATCVYTCGSVCYWQEDIDEALETGYADYKAGTAPGGYPHEYHDYEGFSFPTASPWYEFPILSSYDPYTGGSPGADRVIFDSKGNFDSVITHTGASDDDFVACKKG